MSLVKRLSSGLIGLSVATLLAACTLTAPDRFPQSSPDTQSDDQQSAGQSSDVPASPSPSPSPTPSLDPQALKDGGRTATVVMSGDLLWHSDLWHAAEELAATTGRTPYDFSRLFQDMRPTIEGADMAICHEEVPFAPDGEEPTGYPMFGAPQEVAEFIGETGWDFCTTASNHSIDRGFDGLETTLRILDEKGILHTGTFRSEEERQAASIYTTEQGIKIAVVTGTYGTNGIPLPEGAEWSVSLLDADDMIAQAELARSAGADIVLAAMHGGEEYQVMPNDQQIETAEALTASDAIDLVYGHHVHVVQPWDKVNGKWVVYGLGNMVANHEVDKRRAYEGVTSRFTFAERNDGSFEVTRAEYIPTMVTVWWPGDDLRLWPVVEALENGEGETELLQIAREKTAEAVFALGVEGVEER